MRQVVIDSHWVNWLRNRQWSSQTLVMGAAAILVGLTSGCGVWLFKRLIDLTHGVAFDLIGPQLARISSWAVLLLPAIGGLIVGLILHFFVGEERHHGVAGIMESVSLAGGRLRYQRAPAKVLGAALSIGTGASVGPEDPSVQIGANLGSMLAQWLRLTDDQTRALVAAGAAGGIAAAFNAPIAGLFFALEIILGELGGSGLWAVALSAVTSAVFTQAVSGPQPAFKVPAYEFHSALELPFYLGLGLLAGPLSALYIRTLYAAQDVFHGWRAPRWIKPAAAGLMVGVVGVFLPQIFGIGYDTIEKILGGEVLPLALLAGLLGAKLLMTSISIGGGFPGGVFAPSLFLGATLGAAYGGLINLFFPAINATPAAFAMVGMAAVLAGTVHAPLTAIILLFEMTNDYRIILPLMLAVIVSFVVARLLEPDSVYGLGLARKGIRLERGRDVEVLQGITVGEVMQSDPPTLAETLPLASATEIMAQTRHHGLPVVNAGGELVGILTVEDIEKTQFDDSLQQRSVGDVCRRDLLVAHPDETLAGALRRMSVQDIGRLPVVRRDRPRALVGLLRRVDVIRAYDVALTRRAAMRHRAHQVRLGATSGVTVDEVEIAEGAACEGKRIKEVIWPRDSVIATIRRGHHVIFPHGDTVLQAGDVLTAVVEGSAKNDLEALCAQPAAPKTAD